MIDSIAKLQPLSKLLVALIIPVILLLWSLGYEMESITRIMICWNGFASGYLILCMITFRFINIPGIQDTARKQDRSHSVIFSILVLATLLSLFTVLLLLKSEKEWKLDKGLVEGIYFSGVFFSWLLLHTVYTFRYAHLFYSDTKKINDPGKGLHFPGEKDPDYIDFVYFSFIIGMTFQVSDVTVTSRKIRNVVLFHSFLSFLFNVVVIALCVNAVVNI